MIGGSVAGEVGRETVSETVLLMSCDAGLGEIVVVALSLDAGSVTLLVEGADFVGVGLLISRRGGRDDSRKRHPLHDEQCQ